MARQIRIAISGGGVAGATLLRALLAHPQLDVHIFESAPQFREEGVAFGIGRNATAAMDLIGASTRECLERAGGVQMKGSALWVAQGPEAGRKVFNLDNSTTVVQRAHLLRELLSGLPAERMHASKKLASIDRQSNGSVLLHFADESTHECDILIGADGVHSTVRKIILGHDDPASTPRSTHWWAIMTLNPYQQARTSIGNAPVDIEDARECAWAGDGSFMMSNVLSHGDIVQFSVLSGEKLPLEDPKDEANQWSRTVNTETLKKLFLDKEWMPHLDRAVRELLCNEETRQAIYLWEHLPAHTYVSGPVCMIGDAAHATTPFMGSGGGMCVEDTLIMSTLLGRATTTAEAEIALKVYDQVRRQRTQDVVVASRETGTLITGKDEAIGLYAQKLEDVLANRWDFIFDFDNVKHRDEAITMMNRELEAV
nr:6-methylsalicylic acid decarboxylase atA-like [Quercus suber]